MSTPPGDGFDGVVFAALVAGIAGIGGALAWVGRWAARLIDRFTTVRRDLDFQSRQIDFLQYQVVRLRSDILSLVGGLFQRSLLDLNGDATQRCRDVEAIVAKLVSQTSEEVEQLRRHRAYWAEQRREGRTGNEDREKLDER